MLGLTFGELRSTLRWMIRSPLLSVAVLLALASGMAVNVVMFSIYEAVLLKPLALPSAERLIMIWERNPARGIEQSPTNEANVLDWAGRSRTVERFLSFSSREAVVAQGDIREHVFSVKMTAGTAGVASPKIFAGRFLNADDCIPGRDRVVVVGYSFWRNSLGGRADVIGRPLLIDDIGFTVVGIAAPGMEFPYPITRRRPALWTPLVIDPVYLTHQPHDLTTIGRLAPGFTVKDAQSELSAIARSMEVEHPRTNRGWGVSVAPLHEAVVGGMRPVLRLITVTGILTFAMTCLNVAWVLLSRFALRLREAGVRIALGASGAQLLRLHIVEGATVALLGGFIGLPISAGLLVWVKRAPAVMALPRIDSIALDWRAFAYAVVLIVLTAALFGFAPTLALFRSGAANLIAQRLHSGTSGLGRSRILTVLLVCQVAFSILVVAGAGLTLKPLSDYLDQSADYALDRVVTTGKVQLPPKTYLIPESRVRAFELILERLRHASGVRAAGAASGIHWTDTIQAELRSDKGETNPSDSPVAYVHAVTPGYLETLKARLREGRFLRDGDARRAHPGAIITRSLAQRMWPGQAASGRLLRVQFFGRVPYEVLGVIDDLPDVRALGARPEIYLAFGAESTSWSRMYLIARVDDMHVRALAANLRQIVQSVDAQLHPERVQTLREAMDQGLAPNALRAAITTGFGVLAVLLAVLGVYGMVSFMLASRRPELAMRIALGCSRGRLLAHVFRLSGVPVMLGLTSGSAVFWMLARHGVLPLDTPEQLMAQGLVFSLAVVLAAAALATVAPGVRATRIDPVMLLRSGG